MTGKLEDVIKTSTIIVHKGRYAYLKTNHSPPGNHFMITQDADEITIITEEANIGNIKYEAEEKWFKLLEIKVSAPFQAVGFLASVSRTVAEKGLNILIVSTYSKDYALLREATYEKGLSALKDLGFPLQYEG